MAKRTWREPPRVIAHRGASREAPENTLAALERAVELGAPAVEFDVHLSRDGVPVVVHDETLERTTDGAGPVGERTLAELRRLDAGAWFGDAFRGARIPTLEEAFDALAGRALLDVELKTGDRAYPGIVDRVFDLVDARDLHEDVVVSSFRADTVREAKERGLATALIVPGEPTEDEARRWSAFADAFGIWDAALTPAAIRACRAAKRPLYAWTVDDAARATQLLAAGVDGVITNDVRALLPVLRA